MIEKWERDDSWTVEVVVDDDGAVKVSHLPQLVVPPPNPLTYGYVVMALKAHGYGLVTPPRSSQKGIKSETLLVDNYCCDACIIEGRTADHMLRWDRHTIEVDQETFVAMLDPTPDSAPRLRALMQSRGSSRSLIEYWTCI